MPRHITAWIRQRELGRGTSKEWFEFKMQEFGSRRTERAKWLRKHEKLTLLQHLKAKAEVSALEAEKSLKETELENAAEECFTHYDESDDRYNGHADFYWPENFEPDGNCIGYSDAETTHERVEKEIKALDFDARLAAARARAEAARLAALYNYDDEIKANDFTSSWNDYLYTTQQYETQAINNLKR